MGSFEDALRRLSRLDVEAEARARSRPKASLTPAALQAPTFRAGDTVRDAVTGEEAQVVDTRFILAAFEAPERADG